MRRASFGERWEHHLHLFAEQVARCGRLAAMM
jgi:hypothetical protein